MKNRASTRAPFFVLAGAALIGSAAHACTGAGLITRIEGSPEDVVIMRSDGGPAHAVARPRVLEVVCSGDEVSVHGGARVTLSIDGVGKVTVNASSPYSVQHRGGATLAGNAYREISEKVVPEMKRLPWDVRLKGPTSGFNFAMGAMASGKQTLVAGDRALLVRLAGNAGPYTVELQRDGGAAVRAESGDPEVILPITTLTPGPYRLRATDGSKNAVEAKINVVANRPATTMPVAGLDDVEVAAAASALELAKSDPATWSLEAEQGLNASPRGGLDRERVYQLLESYYDPD